MKWKFALVGLVGVYAALGGYALVTNSSHIGMHSGAATLKPTPPSVKAAGAPSRLTVVPAAPVPASPRSTASSPTPRPKKAAPGPLGVASITAFGPEGTSDGDHPAYTSRVVDGSGAQPWYSSWYASAEFGNLQAGTGLLLDMGKSVAVSSVQLVLGGQPGTDVQVRVGNIAVLPDLSTVSAATDVGGTVQLSTARPATGRYVLVWFTALPPNGQGEYQVSVYHVTVDGT
jgi:hypothetical protein